MSTKQIYKYNEVKDRIIKAVDMITEPIAQTLSPLGSNVIFEDEHGNYLTTNDGATIARSINVKGDVENAIIDIIKSGSLKTNQEVGDGTSSTVLASSILIKEGLRLIENGHNQMEVRDNLIKFSKDMQSELSKQGIKIKSDQDLKFIAKISSNNDEEISNNIVRIMKVVGEDGYVMIDRGFAPETEIIEDTGFIFRKGVFAKELVNKQFQANMLDVPVLITDKRLYYKSEAETILKTVLDAGYNEVVVIAQDFIGEALPFFIANHINNKVKCILVAEREHDILEDLAIYLGGKVISDKKGSIVDKIKIEDFMMAKRVFSDPHKTVISRDKKENNKEIDARVAVLKKEMKKLGGKASSEYTKYEQRISSLINGMVTIKVGGNTNIEVIEKIYRYEDAVNAARSAMKEGYLSGAGTSMLTAYKNIKVNPDYRRMFDEFAEANIRQIAINCGKNPDSILEQINKGNGLGYNAVTDKVEDVIKAGVIEPVMVVKQVIANAVSIANVILTSKWLILYDLDELKEINKNKENN